MNQGKNIMIVGVGGQGTLLASRLLGHALLSQGYDVKISRSGKKELISVTFQTAGKAVRNRYD